MSRPPDVDPTDEELIRRFVAGDDGGFSLLVERHTPRVNALCLRYFRHQADAEDATQEVFLAVYRRAASFAGNAAFTTWLYRVTVNTCNDIQRKRVRRPRSAGYDPDWLADGGSDPIAALETDMDLRAAIAGLAEEFRDVVVLRHLRGLAYAEIVEQTGLPMGTVKSRIHRGHALLAAALSDRGEPSGPKGHRRGPHRP